MKDLKLILTSLLVITGTAGLISCNAPREEKGEEAEYELVTAETVKEQVKTDSAIAYNYFKMETEKIIAANEANMIALKAKMITKQPDIRTQFEKDLEAVRLENQKLKSSLENFTYSTGENWITFKKDLKKDIDKIGKSISTMAERAD